MRKWTFLFKQSDIINPNMIKPIRDLAILTRSCKSDGPPIFWVDPSKHSFSYYYGSAQTMDPGQPSYSYSYPPASKASRGVYEVCRLGCLHPLASKTFFLTN